jgi:hypothetical protein
MRWVVHVAHNWERRGAYRGLVGKPEEKRPLGRARHRLKHKLKTDIQETG